LLPNPVFTDKFSTFANNAYVRVGLIIVLTAITPIVFLQVKPDEMANYRQGRAEEADAKYNEAAAICNDEINSDSATMDTYTLLTWALQRQKKYGEVITRGNQALKIRQDYRIIETMGEAYFYLGNFDASLGYMQLYINGIPSGDRTSVAYFFYR
jgi:tetratricopeptide (TPR) repeat protein